MKKFLKIALIVAAVLGTGALVFYFVAPEMFMNMLDTVSFYLNQPLPIVGISVLTICLVLLKIFSSTSFGKKVINEAKKEVADAKTEFEVKTQKILEVEKNLENKEQEMKDEYQKKIETVYAQFDYFENSIFKSLKEIPNAKVQAELTKFEEGYKQKKEELGLIVGNGYTVIEDALEEMKKEMLKEVKGILNEEKERVDNQATEE